MIMFICHSINCTILAQVGRTLLLLGSFEAAVQVFEEATQLAPRDWELWHNKGACYMAAKQYDWYRQPLHNL